MIDELSHNLMNRLETAWQMLGVERHMREQAEDKLRERNDTTSITRHHDGGLVEDLMDAMASGHKIEAIKAYRSLTGYGLKESKDAVERVMDRVRS